MAYLKPQRAFYIPKGAQKVAAKDGSAVFYLYTIKSGQPAAMCFIGKAQKPSWNFRFKDAAAREKRIAEQLAVLKKRAADKAAERAARNKPHGLEPGVILRCSWGYDQTNVDFYVVTKVPSKTTVELQEIGLSGVDGSEGFMSQNVMPCPDAKIGEPFRRKVDASCGLGSVKISSCQRAYVWEGKESYRSWYA